MRKLFSNEEVADMIARYESGESIAALAERHGSHRTAIERRLISHGVAIRINGVLTTRRSIHRYWLTAKGEAAVRIGGGS